MKFSKIFFGKPDLKLITETDLQEKIIGGLKQGSFESSTIELKSYAGINGIRDKIQDITKNVVALANSRNRGGLLILGIDEGRSLLTPIPVDIQKMPKDRIYQLIESRLLIENPKSFEVHVIISQGNSNSGFIIIEVEVEDRCPHYWGYTPKKEFYPFVRKSEKGVENIPPSEIHRPTGYEVLVNYPRETFRYIVPRNEAIDYPTFLIPLEIKNIGIHPITNVEVKIEIRSTRITQNDKLLWIFKEDSHDINRKKTYELQTIVQSKIKNPLKVKYLNNYDGSLGNLVEITFSEKFTLAQEQQFQVDFPVLAFFFRLRLDKMSFIIAFSSNELGQCSYTIPLSFIRHLKDN